MLLRAARRIENICFDVIFPRQCALCDDEGSLLCTGCKRDLTVWPEGLCAWCSSVDNGSNICDECAPQWGIQGLWIGYRYDDEKVASLVHSLKFQYQESLGDDMGLLLSQQIARLPSEIESIIPIPLDRKRKKERGFNQAYCIAKAMTIRCGVAVNERLLFRTISRAPQATLDAVSREKNIQGVYQVRASDNMPRCVLLIDDVTTTGSTLREAASILREAGVSHIYALVFAHGTPPENINKTS